MSALVPGEMTASRPVRFTPEERVPVIHWIGGRWAPSWTMERTILALRTLEFKEFGRQTLVASRYMERCIPATDFHSTPQ
jgi:hypothetical protein